MEKRLYAQPGLTFYLFFSNLKTSSTIHEHSTPFNSSSMKKLRLDFCGKSIKSVVIDICLDKAAVILRNISTSRCVWLNLLGRHTLREIRSLPCSHLILAIYRYMYRNQVCSHLTFCMLGNFACIFVLCNCSFSKLTFFI